MFIKKFSMGENSLPPQEPMDNGFSSNDENHTDEEADENDIEYEDVTSEEFHAINNQLDALNSALDDIEQKNDDIHAQLLQLLQSNREIRKQMQDSQNVEPSQTKS